mmetsp:Transcript_67304/g.197588  ORF Transcript_67304/g.197588 Transcript_67304/m.197588 type:complete len:215 (-) Transcript_67304:20-664(-)
MAAAGVASVGNVLLGLRGQLNLCLAAGVVSALAMGVHLVRHLLCLLGVLVADHGVDRRRGARLVAVGEGGDDVGRDDLWRPADLGLRDEHDVAALSPVAGQLLGVRDAALRGVLVDLPEVRDLGAVLLPGLVGRPVHGDLAGSLEVRLAASAEGEVAGRQVVHAPLGPAHVVLDEEGVRRLGTVGVRHGWLRRRRDLLGWSAGRARNGAGRRPA